MAVTITVADNTPETIAGLAAVTLDCVAGGASIGFMNPFTSARAEEFWTAVMAAADRGHRRVLVARDEHGIVGTIQLNLRMADNQPHRADVAKMQVHRRGRRQGLGERLLRAIEAEAVAAGRTLLVLDAVTDGGAARLYQRCGWTRVGDIPNYALFPDGTPCSTTVFFRVLTKSKTEHGSPPENEQGNTPIRKSEVK